jgi:diacylglycerol kinase family enzyme
MKAIVLLNKEAGTLTARHQVPVVGDAFSAAGVEAEIRFVTGKRLRSEAQAALAFAADVVVAGGGDGTLSTVAGVLAGTQVPLGILPLGTLNHFARDLGIPFDVQRAARVIAAKHIGIVDVGEVNGRVFINNSSLGIYPRAVLERESLRHKHRLSKWTAMIAAVIKVFLRFPIVRVRIATGADTILKKTPLVFA